MAEALRHRIADLRAATCVYDLLAGKPSIVDIGHTQQLVVILSEHSRLVLSANHSSNPLAASDKIDWSKVTRLKVVRIGELK